MSILEALVLGVVQGATEFLPVSSSAHLVMVPWWFEWDKPPLVFDIAVHLATALAVITYFWRDWLRLVAAGWAILRKRAITEPDEWLVILIIIATIPAAVLGYLFEDYFESTFSDVPMTAVQLLITAGILVVTEQYVTAVGAKTAEEQTWFDATIVGLAQAVAILPGISRSGSTIAAGLFRKVTRAEATRFSFLMSLPVILGAGVQQLLNVITGEITVDGTLTTRIIVGFIASLVVGYASIAFLLGFVRRRKLYPFAVYCVAFSLITLAAIAIRD